MSMKKVIALLLCAFSAFSCAKTPFEVFCDKFPLLSYPIISKNSVERNNFFYFQLDRETTITEIEIGDYIQTTRWNEFQKPTDSVSHIYHYVPIGRVKFGQYIVLFINCGYMPEPKKYEDSDIGAFENMLCVYTKNGIRTASIIFSGVASVSHIDGKFAKEWKVDMPLIYEEATMSADGEIVISKYLDNELYCIDTMYIDANAGKIIQDTIRYRY